MSWIAPRVALPEREEPSAHSFGPLKQSGCAPGIGTPSAAWPQLIHPESRLHSRPARPESPRRAGRGPRVSCGPPEKKTPYRRSLFSSQRRAAS